MPSLGVEDERIRWQSKCRLATNEVRLPIPVDTDGQAPGLDVVV